MLIAAGMWAVLDPRGFYDGVATWPPYNVHFLHDIGAFQIGLGAALLLGLTRRRALFVVLAAVALGQSVHAVVHVLDRDLGGKPSDPIVMVLFAAFLWAGAWAARRV